MPNIDVNSQNSVLLNTRINIQKLISFYLISFAKSSFIKLSIRNTSKIILAYY